MNPSQLIDMVLDLTKKMEAMQIRIQTLETQNKELETQNKELMEPNLIWYIDYPEDKYILTKHKLYSMDFINDEKLLNEYIISIVPPDYIYDSRAFVIKHMFIFSLNYYITINKCKLTKITRGKTLAYSFRKKKNYEPEVYYISNDWLETDKYINKNKISNIIHSRYWIYPIYEIIGSIEDHKQHYIYFGIS